MDAFFDSLKSCLPVALEVYVLEIFAAIVVATTVAFIFLGWLCLSRKSRGRTVCLLGLSNSGKTLLFLQLIQGRYGPTQNSIAANVFKNYECLSSKKNTITLVDIPGSERVRERLFCNYKDSLRGIVMVIDSVNFVSERHDVAELLYDLLSDPALHKTRSPVLLACNKQDMALAESKDEIQEALEKEMIQLQASRHAKLSLLEGGSKQKPIEFLKKGKDFRFADLPSWLKVQFVACSALGCGANADEEGVGVADIKEVKEWLCC